MVPDSARDGNEIGTGFDNRAKVIGRDAANRDTGHRGNGRPDFDDFGGDAGFGSFGLGRLERAKRHVIVPFLAKPHGAMAAV